MEIQKAAQLAIENVLKEGLTDIFDRPFEVNLLKNMEFRKKVENEIIRSLKGNSFESLGVNDINHVLLPKNSPFNFRRCALIHPMDTLKYLALVLTIANDIEKARVPIKSKKVFSYRLMQNKGYLFNKQYNITTFKSKTRDRANMKKTKYIVSCDIANYYDRLNLHRLENTLLSINCDKDKVKLLNQLLLFWSGRDSYGLPVGSNASRIIAEANLIGVDNYLNSMNVDFIRFVDDYRIFAPDAHTAHYWLTILIERLWQDGLTINMSKTKIESYSNDTKNKDEGKNIFVHEQKNNKEGNPFLIRAGYGGTVPTQFRKISVKERNRLEKNDIINYFNEIKRKDILEVSEFVEFIKTIISKSKYKYFESVLELLEEYLQLTPYVVDTLIKHSEYIGNDLRIKIKEYFTNKLTVENYIPEYLETAYIRLLGNVYYSDKKLLMKCFREIKLNTGAYIGRAILDSLEKIVNREDVIEIRKCFNRANLWEKRQIIKIIINVLDKDEKEAWLRNIKYIESSELFLQEVAHPSKKKECKKVFKKIIQYNKTSLCHLISLLVA